MNTNGHDFIDYLGALETKTAPDDAGKISGTCAAVLKKAGLKRKTPGAKKCGRALLIAAAVAVCAVATAAAAGVSVGDMFRGYFTSGGPYRAQGFSGGSSSLSTNQTKVLNDTGNTLNISAANNGTTITAKAAVCDKSSAYILFDVTAPEGTKLNRSDYSFCRDDDHTEMTLLEKGGAKISSTHSWGGGWDYTTLKDADPNDNNIRIMMKINFSGIDLQGKEVHLDLKDITVPDKNRKTAYLPVIQGEWQLVVPLDGTGPSKDLTVNKTTHFKPYADPKAPASDREKAAKANYQCTVKSISLSSLSATADYTGDVPTAKEDSFATPFTMTIRFKDGSQTEILGIGPGTGSRTESTRTYLFNAPIDVSNVVSVAVGDLTVPVN